MSDSVNLKKKAEKKRKKRKEKRLLLQECFQMVGRQNGEKYCQLMQKLTMKHLEPIDHPNSEEITVIRGIHPSDQYTNNATKIDIHVETLEVT